MLGPQALPSWDFCVFGSLDECGRAYLGGAVALVLLLTGLWFIRDLVLDALSDVWPRVAARLPRRWFVPKDSMPAILVADTVPRPSQVGRLWYGATLNGSDPPAADPESAQSALAAIARRDPTFRQDALIDLARRAAPVVLRAWTDQDSRLSRRIMAPLIWEQQKEDILAYRADGRRNVLDGLAVRDARVVAAAADRHSDTVTVRLLFAAADYDVAMDTRAIVRGSHSVQIWSEDWTFQRPAHPGSPSAGGQVGGASCSRCGAPVDLDVEAVCSRCDAELNAPPPAWVLTRIDVVPDAPRAQAA